MPRCALLALVLLVGCEADRGPETLPCAPGAVLAVGCNQACGLGSCAGDPAIRVCDGTIPTTGCNESTRLTEADRSPPPCASACPVAFVTCPASGSITVVPVVRSSISACDWAVEERDPSLFPDAAVDDDAGTPLDAAVLDAAALDAAVLDAALLDAAVLDASGTSAIDAAAEDASSDAASDAGDGGDAG